MIAWSDADAETIVGAVGAAATIWNARGTFDAGANCASPACSATTSHVPTRAMVMTPNVDTAQALFVVPDPREYVTVRFEDAAALNAKLAAPKATFAGWSNAMFWFSDPTEMVCDTAELALKLVEEAAEAETTQSPVVVKVTVAPANVHDPATENVGATPEADPVTVEIASAATEYVPFGRGSVGTVEVNDTTCPAWVMVMVCDGDVLG